MTTTQRLTGMRSLSIVRPKHSGVRVAITLLSFLTVIVLCLVFVPWQQTVIGYGQVTIFSAMDRPQNIEAQISARLTEWQVQEGQLVKQGVIIARMEDIDSKFLDPEQAKRLRRQREALIEQRARATERAANLARQQASLGESRDAAISTARQRIQQAKQREKAAGQSLIASEKGVEIARDVSRVSAGERLRQATDRIRQAEQSVQAAEQDLETSRLQRDRLAELFKRGLRSQRDDELAQNDLVKKQTDVARAKLAFEIARRDANVTTLDQNRTDIEIERVRTEVARSEAGLDVARRDVTNALLDLNKVIADTAASLSSVGASLESARESIAKIDSDLQKIDTDLRNVEERQSQQVIRAPRDGRVVRLLKVGTGETVKAGDVMAVILPDTKDQAVELMVTDNDVALLTEGRKVRLQFAGWPALQFSGFPSVAVGTFGGQIRVIDALDDGTARYRIIVEPDFERIAAKEDERWPTSANLRPGAEVTGWILLETVPLGFELWRQFNAFPPTVKRPPVGQKEEKSEYGKSDDKEKKSPFLKVKGK